MFLSNKKRFYATNIKPLIICKPILVGKKSIDKLQSMLLILLRFALKISCSYEIIKSRLTNRHKLTNFQVHIVVNL